MELAKGHTITKCQFQAKPELLSVWEPHEPPEVIVFHSPSRLSDGYNSRVCEAALLPLSAPRKNYAQPLQLHNRRETHTAI